ncbi:hypothetical protein QR680_012104 [Steinernema hermaphroditum]|uniref:C2H2-type domain-containing protein n=1 Tax=Steinernema hermaphroditum TaxID=289476 RepID=A0AA39I0Y2_9BILA|nr:hypothetical protein QR680_012104 [Steinernema hermaphroditum]
MAVESVQHDGFYVVEDLELLAEVANHGTLYGQRVPMIIQDSAKNYRHTLLRHLEESAAQLRSEFNFGPNDIDESVRALTVGEVIIIEDEEDNVASEQDVRGVQDPPVKATTEVVQNVECSKPPHCQESVKTMRGVQEPLVEARIDVVQNVERSKPPHCQESVKTVRGVQEPLLNARTEVVQNVERSKPPHCQESVKTVRDVQEPLVEAQTEVVQNVECSKPPHCQESVKTVRGVQEPLVEARTEVVQNVERSKPPYCQESVKTVRGVQEPLVKARTEVVQNVERSKPPHCQESVKKAVEVRESPSKKWHCKLCNKWMVATMDNMSTLLRHIIAHESISCPCPVKRCSSTCVKATSLRQHLQSVHGFERNDLNKGNFAQVVVNLEKTAEEKAKAKLNVYFPKFKGYLEQAGGLLVERPSEVVQNVERSNPPPCQKNVTETVSAKGNKSWKWHCKVCKKWVVAKPSNVSTLICHIMCHEHQSCPCPVKRCDCICTSVVSLRQHLKDIHGFNRKQLVVRKYIQVLEEMERSAKKTANAKIGVYFPAFNSNLEQAKDTFDVSLTKRFLEKNEQLWQCQKCMKQLKQASAAGLLSHIATHEKESCPCFMEGCNFIGNSTSSLGDHLRNEHEFSAETLKLYRPLLERLEIAQRDRVSAKLNDYFPPSSCITSEVGNSRKRARQQSRSG